MSIHGKKTNGAYKIGSSTDKLEVDRALILTPSLHQCAVFKVLKATVRATQKGEILTQGRDVSDTLREYPLERSTLLHT